MCLSYAFRNVVIEIIQTLQERQFIILFMNACRHVDINGKKSSRIPTFFDL